MIGVTLVATGAVSIGVALFYIGWFMLDGWLARRGGRWPWEK